MSLNKVYYSRSIYNGLDLLGDVGGLYSILLDIGALFFSAIHFLFSSPLETFLQSSVFKNKPRMRTSQRNAYESV